MHITLELKDLIYLKSVCENCKLSKVLIRNSR